MQIVGVQFDSSLAECPVSLVSKGFANRFVIFAKEYILEKLSFKIYIDFFKLVII